MTVIRTDQWLIELYSNPIKICERIITYFDSGSATELYQYLIQHGMYRSYHNGIEQVKKLQKNEVWRIVRDEKERLQKLWDGPTVPVFIFPVDKFNKKIRRDYNSKSGLAFKDKLFLFISEDNVEKEIRALFTHEYHHICRLNKLNKTEENFVLLDTIILEGLAENAVYERFGEEYVASWTSYYSKRDLEKMWKKFILPNKHILKSDPTHEDILYGLRFFPKMAGYCVGYYLVRKFLAGKKLLSKDLLNIKAEDIAYPT
ncbi:DUF2268 domain-containing protein [Calidifontibacillus oryziterrae]|uniref:DUF2268 domain-containing protein n=1 Tax=Calidifontibacillus oryziterrae TaxID=1191699 RepID=UPI0002F75570|nr:DUF2268 domain-containing protein [Calidifontibacillus oryziterrae]